MKSDRRSTPRASPSRPWSDGDGAVAAAAPPPAILASDADRRSTRLAASLRFLEKSRATASARCHTDLNRITCKQSLAPALRLLAESRVEVRGNFVFCMVFRAVMNIHDASQPFVVLKRFINFLLDALARANDCEGAPYVKERVKPQSILRRVYADFVKRDETRLC